MDLRLPPKPASDQKLRRAEALDALDSVLPFDRRDFLAELLTADDVATLRHLAKEGIGENSLRALASDLGYLEAWSLAATGFSLPWPGAGGAADKIRRPSPVGSCKTRSFVHARHARRGGCSAQDPRPVARRRTARAEHRAPASVQLVDADQMARS